MLCSRSRGQLRSAPEPAPPTGAASRAALLVTRPEGPNPSSVPPLTRAQSEQAEEISALAAEQSPGKSRGGNGSGVIGRG